MSRDHISCIQNKKKPNKEQLDEIFDSSIFKLLSEPIRIDILKLLALKGELDITQISGHFNQDRSVISRHLKLLFEGGLLIKTKQSRSTIYQVDGLAFLHKVEKVVSGVKEMLSFCCDEIYTDLYSQGLTYKDYIEKQK
ncbi:ArsR/SmtB family transcription factor [Anaerosacchariphilus polymeriproducens]|uniref:Transcriptional regulator n=1 Tax=Anaerosacchariphilus polymeriproducens TaxID=1812858 RepID=A0A371AR29_9FIRM|nr:helix-turn-helix transcriptional regulator [Anaerosacchariphilus polymeriproducens]RDU21890.1 transcriptional regulator [Anaerosacchariphilus polymeriproducens]